MTTIDTNVLVRGLVSDGTEQAASARQAIRNAETIVATLPALCEAVWVLRVSYGKRRQQIAEILDELLTLPNLVLDRPAVHFGMDALRSGADFADAVIGWEGKRMGADEFLSFDHKAVRVLASLGLQTRLLG